MARILAGVFLACSLMFGAATAQTPQTDAASPRSSIMLARVIMAFPAGTVWVDLKGGSLFCDAPGNTRTATGARDSQELPPYAAAFKIELERAGYKTVTPGQDNLFDPDAAAADFQAAAVVTDGHIKGCIREEFGELTQKVRGESLLKIDWQVYSPIRKQVVASLSTSGTAKLEDSTEGGAQLLMMGAFSSNVRELASRDEFRAAMRGARPLANSNVLMPGKQDKIVLMGSVKAGKRSVSDAVGSVVTILTGSGSGSGDLVSSDGYMLTNVHVVGDEKSVRVRWSDGIETVAEVVRVAKDRDIALIKTNPRDREPLAIKRGPVTPGARVYAIGSPLGKAYQGTVSSGVVSATRTIEGLRYIQSDVSITHGSSGGALLDENGSVIAIAVSGIEVGGPVGINFFIPIGDAMDFLNLEPN